MAQLPVADYSPGPQAPAIPQRGGVRGFEVDPIQIGAAPQIDPRGFVAEAGASIGPGLQDLGSTVTGMYREHVKAVEQTQVLDAEAGMQAARDNIAAKLAGEKNTLKWGQLAAEEFSKFEGEYLSQKDLLPEAKAKIGQMFGRFKVTELADVGRQAAVQADRDRGAAFVGSVRDLQRIGDYQSADKMIDEGRRQQIIGDDMASGLKTQNVEAKERAERERQMNAFAGLNARDPAAALAAAKDPKTPFPDEISRAQALNMAQQGMREKTSEISNMVKDGLSLPNGDMNKIVSDGQIDDIAKHNPKYMTPQMTEAAKADLAQRNEAGFDQRMQVEGPTIASALSTEISLMDPKKNTESDFFAKRLEIARLPTALREDLNNKLDFVWTGKGDGNAKNPMKGLGDDILQQGLLAGMYGATEKWQDEKFLYDKNDPSKGDYRKYDADSPNTFKGKYVPDPAAKAQAITRKAEAGARFYRWLDQNPKATEQQVKDFIWNDSQESIRAGLPDQYQKGWTGMITGPIADATAAAMIQGQTMKPPGMTDTKTTTGAQGEAGPQGSEAVPESLVNEVKNLEGFSAKAFGDFKQTSVGYGTRARAEGETITIKEADRRLREELTMHAGRVDSAAEKRGWRLTKAQREALISFDFNTGQGAELVATSDSLDEVKSRMQMYTKVTVDGVKKENKGLANRRRRELEWFGE